jgi:hypothetical protein
MYLAMEKKETKFRLDLFEQTNQSNNSTYTPFDTKDLEKILLTLKYLENELRKDKRKNFNIKNAKKYPRRKLT